LRQHAITITAAILGLVWLGSIATQLFFVAGLATIPYLIAAIVGQIAAFLIASAVLLVTNTRRPAGVDPNVPPRRRDPFGMTSDELQRDAVMLPDARPYGRRVHDDVAVVKRLIGRFEDEDSLRPAPKSTPAWAIELQQQHEQSGALFTDEEEKVSNGDSAV